jgi:hypothetical protein
MFSPPNPQFPCLPLSQANTLSPLIPAPALGAWYPPTFLEPPEELPLRSTDAYVGMYVRTVIPLESMCDDTLMDGATEV